MRVEEDASQNTVQYKIREAELQKVPYVIVIGDKEQESNTLAIRERGVKNVRFGVHSDDFLHEILEKIRKRE